MNPPKTGIVQIFLKTFFHLLYHQFAWTYDLVAWLVSLGQWNRWISTTLPFLAGDNILELGHGPGALQRLSHQKGLNIFGLDLSPQMSRICRRRLTKLGFLPNLVSASGVTLPFRTDVFSSVVATFPTEYIALPETLNEIYRILSPGGSLVLLPLAWIKGSTPIHKLAGWLFKATGQTLEIDHPIFTAGLERIKRAGFQVETQTIDLPYSRVLIVLAKKPN